MENKIEDIANSIVEELSGISDLAAVAQKKATVKNVLKAGMTKIAGAAKIAAQKAPINPGRAKFLQVVNQLSPAEKLAIEADQRQWDFQVYYKRVRITGFGGDVQLWDETNVRLNGVSNINENAMPAGNNMLFEFLQIRWAWDPTGLITDPTALEYHGFTDVPAAIANCEMTIKSGERDVLQRLPLSQTFAGEVNAMQTSVDVAQSGYDLKKDGVIWRSGERITVTLHTPAGSATTIPTGNHFLEIMVSGTAMKNRV